MDIVWQELIGGFSDSAHLLRVFFRLLIAVLLGGLVGFERQHEGKSAGMRTHMLVALGAALFTIVPIESHVGDVTRVIQGIAAGIGFLGAGAILKPGQEEVKGLNTAASIWLTAAAGMAVGAGLHWPAIIGIILAWLILDSIHKIERWLKRRILSKQPKDQPSSGEERFTPHER